MVVLGRIGILIMSKVVVTALLAFVLKAGLMPVSDPTAVPAPSWMPSSLASLWLGTRDLLIWFRDFGSYELTFYLWILSLLAALLMRSGKLAVMSSIAVAVVMIVLVYGLDTVLANFVTGMQQLAARDWDGDQVHVPAVVLGVVILIALVSWIITPDGIEFMGNLIPFIVGWIILPAIGVALIGSVGFFAFDQLKNDGKSTDWVVAEAKTLINSNTGAGCTPNAPRAIGLTTSVKRYCAAGGRKYQFTHAANMRPVFGPKLVVRSHTCLYAMAGGSRVACSAITVDKYVVEIVFAGTAKDYMTVQPR